MNYQSKNFLCAIENQYYSIILICLLPLVYLSYDTVILNYMDMYQYLIVVKDFQNGDYSFFYNSRRTNLFPLILWFNFKIFGNTLLAIKYLYVFVLILISLECYVLGKLLFNNNSGFVTAILVSTSYTFSHFLFFPHIDLILLAMLLACLITIFIALEKKDSNLWFIISGVLIGLSFLLKEASVWLLFFIPIYALLKGVKSKQIAKQWGWQLLPLLFMAAPIVIYKQGGFYGRYINYPLNWLGMIVSGDMAMLARQGGGAFQQEASFWNIFTFLFRPIFWQWESILPIPQKFVLVEQLLIICSGLYYFFKKTSLPDTKRFLLTILIIFFPRYMVFSVNAYKVRQILIFFFVFYLILGNELYYLFTKTKAGLVKYTDRGRVCAAMILIVLTFCVLRALFCIDGLMYTLNSAEYNYQRKAISYLQVQTNHN